MLKMRSLTEQLYVDEVDVDEEGIGEAMMDENAIANVSRPGTSLKQPGTGAGAPSRGVRCVLSGQKKFMANLNVAVITLVNI